MTIIIYIMLIQNYKKAKVDAIITLFKLLFPRHMHEKKL